MGREKQFSDVLDRNQPYIDHKNVIFRKSKKKLVEVLDNKQLFTDLF